MEDCLPSLKAFDVRIQEVQEELLARSVPLKVTTVVITSDEPRAEGSIFWEDVRKRGWFAVDHDKEKTVEKYGEWVLVFQRLCFLSVSSTHISKILSVGIIPSCLIKRFILWLLGLWALMNQR